MRILNKSKKLTQEQLYNLMSPEKSEKVLDEVGNNIEVKHFVLFEEIDEFDVSKKVLVLESKEDVVFVTITKSFITEFEKILLIFGNPGVIKVNSEPSNSGYEIVRCRKVV